MNRRRSRLSFLLSALVFFSWSGPAIGQSMRAVVIGGEKIHLRTGPGTEYAPETWIGPGEQLIVLERVGEWTRVQTLGGRIGFVWDDFLAHSGEMIPGESATAPQAGTVPPPTVGAAPSPREFLRIATRPPATARPPTRAPTQARTPSAAEAAAPPSPAIAFASGETRDQLLDEVALLRTEIEELKRGLAEREAEATAQARRPLAVEEPAAVPTAGGLTNPLPDDGGGRGVRTVSVAIVALGIGWILGSTFTRRRSRSQKNRLRF